MVTGHLVVFPGWEDPGSEMGTLQLPPNTQLLGIGFGGRLKRVTWTPWKPIICSPKRSHFKRKVLFQPLFFSRDTLVFGEYVYFFLNFWVPRMLGGIVMNRVFLCCTFFFISVYASRLSLYSMVSQSKHGRVHGLRLQNWGPSPALQDEVRFFFPQG